MVRLVGRCKLNPPLGEGKIIKRWIASWIAEIGYAHWKRPADVLSQFPHARVEQDGRFVFPIANHPSAIQVLIFFPRGVAVITGLLSQ